MFFCVTTFVFNHNLLTILKFCFLPPVLFSVSLFLKKLLVDVTLHVLTVKQHVQSDLVRGRHVDAVPEPDPVVELVVGLKTNMRTVVHD